MIQPTGFGVKNIFLRIAPGHNFMRNNKPYQAQVGVEKTKFLAMEVGKEN